MRSHAFARLRREPHRAVTNRYGCVTNAGRSQRPARSIECDAVACLSHGQNVARVSRIVFELSAQLGHMGVDRTADDLSIIAPHVAEEIESWDDRSVATEERHQQLELLRPQRHGKAAPKDAVRARADLD